MSLKSNVTAGSVGALIALVGTKIYEKYSKHDLNAIMYPAVTMAKNWELVGFDTWYNDFVYDLETGGTWRNRKRLTLIPGMTPPPGYSMGNTAIFAGGYVTQSQQRVYAIVSGLEGSKVYRAFVSPDTAIAV